jgi:hypothetical protein
LWAVALLWSLPQENPRKQVTALLPGSAASQPGISSRDKAKHGLPSGRPRVVNEPANHPISALPPQLGTMLIWPVISSVTRPLLLHDLVIRQHP